MVDILEQQLENNKQDYNETPTPPEGVRFNAEAKHDQFLGGGGSQTQAPDAASSVPFATQTVETPNSDNERKQRSKYRHELVEKLVELEQQAIQEAMLRFKENPTKSTLTNHITGEMKESVLTGEASMRAATLDAFWKSGFFTGPFNDSEEAQDVRNKLAESAWEERKEWLATLTDEERRILREGSEFNHKRNLILQKYNYDTPGLATFTDEEREIWSKAFELDSQSSPIKQKFRKEHPEAWRIAVNVGINKRDRFGNLLPDDQRLWQEEIAAAQEAQKKEAKTEAESTDENVVPNEITAEQDIENFTVRDASGNNYQISLHGDLTTHSLLEALKAAGAEPLAAQVETLSKEQDNLHTLLSASKITVTPLRETPNLTERKKAE